MKAFLKHAVYVYALFAIASAVAHAPLTKDTAGARAGLMVALVWPMVVLLPPPVPTSAQGQ